MAIPGALHPCPKLSTHHKGTKAPPHSDSAELSLRSCSVIECSWPVRLLRSACLVGMGQTDRTYNVSLQEHVITTYIDHI